MTYFVAAIFVFGLTLVSLLCRIRECQSAVNRLHRTYEPPSVPGAARWWDFLPPPALLLLAALIAIFSFHLALNELVEPIAAVLVLLYAWHVAVARWSANQGAYAFAHVGERPAAANADDCRSHSRLPSFSQPTYDDVAI